MKLLKLMILSVRGEISCPDIGESVEFQVEGNELVDTLIFAFLFIVCCIA